MKKMCGIFKTVTTMKKIMKPFVLVAAAAMALASCQKNEMHAPEKQDVHFTINAGIETKTSIVEGKDEENNTVYTAQWDGNEELGLLFAAPTDKTEAEDVVTLANTISGRTASFQGNVEGVDATGTFYSFYPASAFKRGYEQGDARLDLKNAQKPTATSFDPTCDILVAKPYDYIVEEGVVVAEGLEFARLMSVLRIDLKSTFADIQNEYVESVSFTAGDVQITGYARIFLDNPKFDKWASNEAHWRTVTANYDSDLVSINGASNSVYLVIAPVTIPANKDLTFEIKTKNYNISKTVKSPEMKFTAGKVSKINLTIEEKNCEKIDVSVDYSGEYLIVGDNSGAKYAAVKYDGTSSNLKGVALTMEDDKILEFDAMADSKMVVTKVVGGTYDGLYTIMDASGKYLYAASSSGNQLKSAALSTSTPQHYYWSIVENEGVYEIIASKSANRNVMQFNYNNGSPIFNCYSSASQKAVALYAYSDIKPDTTPKIFVTNTTYSVKATDTSVEIPYNVKNITGTISATVADDATISNINTNVTDVTDGKVTISFAANNESAEKTATIVLSYEGAQSVNVVITQEGKPAEGDTTPKFVKVTAAPADWSGIYLIVYEKGNVAFDGSLSSLDAVGNEVKVTIANNEIAYTETLAKSTFEIAKNGTSYSIKSASGSYIGRTATSNGLTTSKTTVYSNNISMSNGTITIASSGGPKLQYYSQSGSQRFRYYATTQQAIQLYRLEGGESGGETPDPNPDEEPSTGVSKTAQITFGTNNVKINAASVTGTDSENNNWTITTAGTTSYTANSSYYQVGSSKTPATSITFTTTLPAGASVSNVEAKFGGFSGTAGNVTMKVGDTSVGTGKLNATSDVIVKSTSTASGNKVTVTITNIAKGVKCYYISVNYTD